MNDLLRATGLWEAQLGLSECLQEIEALRQEPRAAVSVPWRAIHSIAFPELHLDDVHVAIVEITVHYLITFLSGC